MCELCRKRIGSIRCDGLVNGGQTCDRRMCRKCAGAAVELVTDAMYRCTTRDLCPDCKKFAFLFEQATPREQCIAALKAVEGATK